MQFYKLLIFCLLYCAGLPSASAKIIFQSTRVDGDHDIYVMEDDGSNVQRILNSPYKDGWPRWSPDGRQIAFDRVTRQKENPGLLQVDVYLMNADGSQQQQLTHLPGVHGIPIWAPDGQRIAFESDMSGVMNIHVIDILNRETRQLTNNKDPLLEASNSCAWSPDGRYIAYRQRVLVGWTTIYIMEADGKNPRPLSKAGGTFRYAPRWSPDGQKILYCDAEYSENHLVKNKIVIRHRWGHLLKELETPEGWLINAACWMDNGRYILIGAERLQAAHRQSEIYRYSLTTDKITNLTNHPAHDRAPDWISDKVLSVSPLKKKLINWGEFRRDEVPRF